MTNALKEACLRLILSGFTLKNGQLLVSKAFLIFKGMKDTIESLVCQAKKNNSGKWISEKVNGRLYVVLNSIPEQSRTKLDLHFPQDVIKEMLVTHGHVEDDAVLDSIKAEAYLKLQTEIVNYKTYLFNFYDLVSDENERISLAKTYAILKVILAYIEKYPRGMIRYFYGVVAGLKGHKIPTSSENYFYKYVDRIKRAGIQDGLLHGLKGKPSNHLKLTDEIKHLIIFFKTHGNPTSARKVQEALSRAIRTQPKLKYLEGKIPDEKTVSAFLSEDSSKNQTAICLLDYNAFEAKILGYLPAYKALHPLTRVFIDGYVIQVFCSDDKTLKPITLVGVFIMDDFSRVVICEICEAEDHHLIAKTFAKFLRFTNYKMAYEVISDKFSAYMCKAFPNFVKFLTETGLEWKRSKNPKRKSPLERWFESWQSCSLSDIVGYRGEGIRSKRENARPSREVTLMVSKSEFLKGKNEMIRYLMATVDDYNKNSFFKDAPSPFDLYRLKKTKHARQLQEYYVPYFFWERHSVPINGSMVIIQKKYDSEKSTSRELEEVSHLRPKQRFQKWFYRFADFDFSLRNGSEVDAYHWPDDDKLVYLFESNSSKYICTLSRHGKIKGASADQTHHDRKIIANFGISKADLHQAYVDNIDTLQQLVKEFTGVKDLSELTQAAEAKKIADEYIGNKIGITTPTPEPNLFDAHKWKEINRRPISRKPKTRKYKTGIKDTLGSSGA